MNSKSSVLFLAAIIVILFSGCPISRLPLSLTVSPKAIELYRGTSASLTAEFFPVGNEGTILWESADPSIVTVEQDGRITAISEGDTTVTAYCQDDPDIFDSCLVHVLTPAPEDNITVLISREQIILVTGEEKLLSAFILPEGISQEITWSSRDPAVASVNSQGLVKALTVGSTVITACSSADASKSAYCVVDVEASGSAASVSVNPAMATIRVEETIALTAEVSNLSNTAVSWSSNDPSIATVDEEGKVTGVAAGSAVILAFSMADNSAIGTAIISVLPREQFIPPIAVVPSNIEILVDESFTLQAEIQPSVRTITWESRDPIVAVVDETGIVRGIAPGTTEIYAINVDNREIQDSCTVVVSLPLINVSVSITPPTVNLDIHQTFQLTAEVLPDDIDQSVLWSSDNTAVAIVDSLGLITARQEGTAIISALSNYDLSKSGFSVVNVSSIIVAPENVTITPFQAAIEVGERIQLSAEVSPPGTDQRVYWSSSDNAIAVVDIWGEVRGIAAGNAVITAASALDSTMQDHIPIQVIDPYKDLVVTLETASLSMAPGEMKAITAVITPGEIDDKRVTWNSVNENIARVDMYGTITAVNEGITTITARSVANPRSFHTCTVYVAEREIDLSSVLDGYCDTGDALWYSFIAGVDCDYEIYWQELTATYPADIRVSLYGSNRVTPYLSTVNDSPARFTSEKCERIYLKVEENGNPGSFQLGCTMVNSAVPDTWTIMIYSNGYRLEDAAIANVMEMITGCHDDIGINIVLLIDKTSTNDYSLPYMGTSGTSLFVVTPGKLIPVYNQNLVFAVPMERHLELNMGDASVLRRFIEFSKDTFPAEKYALFINAHGQAAAGLSGDDLEDHDRLHPGEISSVLGAGQSVNLLVFNACLMGNSEVAYQFRRDPGNSGFSSEILVASPGKINQRGIDYYGAFRRISKSAGGTLNGEVEMITGGAEQIYNPIDMTAREFSLVLVEEHRDDMYDTLPTFADYDSLNSYDLSRMGAVKTATDRLAVSLYANSSRDNVEAIRDNPQLTTRYFNILFDTEEERLEELNNFPYYDLKALCEGIVLDSIHFSLETRGLAQDVVDRIDETILYSYFGSYLSRDNLYGLSVFFTHGNTLYEGIEMFRHQWWYNAQNTLDRPSNERFFGELAWCIDKETDNTNMVDNWFELLDAWYDPEDNGIDGGSNRYQY
jgi:clostripain